MKPASGSLFLPFFGVASTGLRRGHGGLRRLLEELDVRVEDVTRAGEGEDRCGAHEHRQDCAPRTMTSRRRYQRGRSDDTPWRLARRQDAARGSAALTRRRRARGRGRRLRGRRRRARPAARPRAARARLRGRGRRGGRGAPRRGAGGRRGGRPRALRHRHRHARPEATFDLAGARRERYERPGALPEVELGASLREDLERRDFTVNAIALHLADGELTWLPGAEEDLRAGRLRVLHDGSFRDDPTRLLRLARYAARLGFEPEERTDRLAAEAVAGGAVDTVTGSRLGAELRLLLRGAAAGGAAGARAPRARAGRCSASRSHRTAATIAAADALWPRRPRRARRRADGAGRSRPAGVPGPRARRRRPRAPRPSRSLETDDAALWRRFRREPPEVAAVAGARGDAAAARRWLDDVPPPPAGHHRRRHRRRRALRSRGRRGARRAMVAMLEGRADTREEQLAAALG